MLNRAATDIQTGKADAIMMGGAESWRTRMAYRGRGERPQWTMQSDNVMPDEIEGTELEMSNEVERERGVIMPIQVYPMFESALRFATQRSIDDHIRHISQLWAGFSRVAAENPYAAQNVAMSAEAIGTPGPSNRMIGLPYPKLMNSNNNVNQAAAVLICSLDRARSLGVARERLVFPQVGSETADTPYVSNRSDMSSSPAISSAGKALFEHASMGVDDVTYIDLYSCFPSAVQVAATGLGIGLDRQLTITGGLTFAGGPWNNYVSHSIATMAEALRRDPGALGLCSANGGLLTKHALGLYSTEPPRREFRVVRPAVPGGKAARHVTDANVTGPAVIESYTVMHDSESEPETAVVTALLPDASRTWRSSQRSDLLSLMITQEFCGTPVNLLPGGGFDLV
jgi:acetyl-CoA C-acetyltransferase